MLNLALFVLTVLGYGSGVYLFIWTPETIAEFAVLGVTLSILCAPFNINGNIYTILGNARSEKNIYAFCSLYQKAKEDAFSVLSFFGFQKAQKNATTLLGVMLFQQGEESYFYLGIIIFQFAEKETKVLFGIVGLQFSYGNGVFGAGVIFVQNAEDSARIIVGCAISQTSEKRIDSLIVLVVAQDAPNIDVLFGLAIYQEGSYIDVLFGIVGIQNGDHCTMNFGFVGFQNSIQEVEILLGLVLYQKVLGNSRIFSICSDIKQESQ